MKTLMTGAAMALMLSGTAYGDSMDWDANADAQIDETEFRTGLGDDRTFENWDADRDGALTQDEFDAGMWSSFDQDRDGILNEPEGVTLDAMRTGWEVNR